MRRASGRTALIAALFALANPSAGSAQGPPQAANPQAARPAQIDRNGVLILIRSARLAVHHANETGNYTVLRDLSAPGFRDANNAARLGDIFASQRAQKLDLSGVAALDPQLTLLPQIEGNGLLHMAGFFPSVPSQVNFELLFAPVEGRWRLFGLSVNVGSAAPAAPQPPQAPPTPPQAPKAEPRREPRKAEPPKPSPKANPADRPPAPQPQP